MELIFISLLCSFMVQVSLCETTEAIRSRTLAPSAQLRVYELNGMDAYHVGIYLDNKEGEGEEIWFDNEVLHRGDYHSSTTNSLVDVIEIHKPILQVEDAINEAMKEYKGKEYNLITNNCTDFISRILEILGLQLPEFEQYALKGERAQLQMLFGDKTDEFATQMLNLLMNTADFAM